MPARPWIVTALLAAATAPGASAQRSPLELLLHRDTLSNGLQLIVVENHAAPLATVLVAVRNGAFTQQPGEEGLAHVYEHVLFRTYEGNPLAFASEVARLNGDYNGTTGQEVVTYFVRLPSARTPDGIRLLARLIPRARFKDADLAEERPVVLDELARDQSDPEQALAQDVSRQLWGEAWHRKDAGGDSTSLRRITLERLKETYARYYIPNNAALIVTGDVSASAVLDAARRHFGKWGRGPDPFADRAFTPIRPLTGNRAVVMGKEVRDVTILVRLHGPSLRADTASTYALDLLFAVLNDASSAFQRRLVEGGLFQRLEAGYETLHDVGPITIEGKTTPERAQEALVALVNELDGLDLLTGLTDEDLAIGKKRRQVATALSLERTAALAPGLAWWWASAGIDYYLTYYDRMNAQTLEDLRRAAMQYVVDRPKVIGVLGSPLVVPRIAEWLRGRVAPRP